MAMISFFVDMIEQQLVNSRLIQISLANQTRITQKRSVKKLELIVNLLIEVGRKALFLPFYQHFIGRSLKTLKILKGI